MIVINQSSDKGSNKPGAEKNIIHYRVGNSILIERGFCPDPLTNYSMDIHCHPYYEIYMLHSGDVVSFIEGTRYSVEPGDLLIINNRELHRMKVTSQTPYDRLKILFDVEYIISYLDRNIELLSCFENRRLGERNRLRSAQVQQSGIEEQLMKICDEIECGSSDKHIMIETLLVQLLVSINRLYSVNTEDVSCCKQHEKVKEIIKHINHNLDKELQITEIAQQFYISENHLCRLFKKHTGFTVKKYINHKRINLAKELLLKGINCTDTAYKVGYNNYSTFYRTFVKHEHKSPQEYLKLVNSVQ